MTPVKNSWDTQLFSAQEAAQLTITPQIVYRGPVSPTGQNREMAHPFFTWWWVDRGEVTVTTRSERVVITAGHWVLIPNGLWRRQEFSPSAELISINFIILWSKNLPIVRGKKLFIGTEQTIPGLIRQAERVVFALEKEERKLFVWHQLMLPLSCRLKVMSALYDFVNDLLAYAVSHGAILAEVPTADARIDWVLQDLLENLRAGPLPFERWRERIGLGRAQLERLAKKHLNRSLHTYRDELLATAATRALTSQRHLVKQVAVQFGFVDTAHFCRWLRAKTGYTPATLQKIAGV